MEVCRLAHEVNDASERVGWQKVCVAMANKNARILWAVMTREAAYDPHHVSIKPACKLPPEARARTALPAMAPSAA